LYLDLLTFSVIPYSVNAAP